MLARTSIIRHASSGVSLSTPLLIPSFSSKGFGVSQADKTSEIGKFVELSAEFITRVCLVSAYDVSYGHVPAPATFPFKPELMFLDSGGYEKSRDKDYSSVIDPVPAPDPWDETRYRNVLTAWPDEVPAVFVSYDDPDVRQPIKEQILRARELFTAFPKHVSLFLIKPETLSQRSLKECIHSITARADDLTGFQLLGVTEKELGNSMLERMVQLALLRRALDEAGLNAPIHVFGALDPLTVCLYFIAGGEVFDGLTWLRYAYHNGLCIYMHNYGVVKLDLAMHDRSVTRRTLVSNLYELEHLENRLRDFESTKDFAKLAPHDDIVRQAADSLETRLKRRA